MIQLWADQENLVRGMVLIPTNVCDYKELAKQKLPRMVYDYYALGAEDQHTGRTRKHSPEFSKLYSNWYVLVASGESDIIINTDSNF